MRRLLLFSFIWLAFGLAVPLFAQSADPSDMFYNAYMANEQGEAMESAGNARDALSKFRYAASLLEQISRDNPSWSTNIVEYRKQRVSANILEAQKDLHAGGENTADGAPPAARPSAAAPIEGDLPQKEEGFNPAGPDIAGPSPAGGDAGMREQLEQLQSDLRASQQKLKAVQQEKARMAGRLDETLRQLDDSKVSEAELKAHLKQTQDSYQNLLSDRALQAGSQEATKGRLSELENALEDAEADRDAADEQSAELARRAGKARVMAQAEAQQAEAATAHAREVETKYADAGKIAGQLDEARKQIAALTKDRDTATARAGALEQQFAQASKTAAQLAEAQKMIATLNQDKAANAKAAAEFDGKLADAHKEMADIAKNRDAALAQVTALNGKLAGAQKEIASVKTERDHVASQRDQALADLGKARDAQKKVDQLLTDNATLMQKVAADEKTIHDFKSGSPEKDKQIADLRKQVSETQRMLAAAQKQRDDVQATLNDLQHQFDRTSTELTDLKTSGVSPEEKKRLTDENGLLRGIVLRQLKEQARRDQAKKLVMSELSKLQVQSDTLLQQVDYLGQPITKLTPQERALFKDPEIEIADDDSAITLSVAAPKPAQAAPAGSPLKRAPAGPSATPMQVAKLTRPAGLVPAPATSPAASQASPSPASAASAAAAPPPGMMEDAKEAKEDFDREDYRETEKIYAMMLAKAPNNLYVLSNLGVAYFRDHKYKLAEETLKKAIAVAPQDTFSQCTLGIVYYQQQDYDDAVTALTRALALDPRYAVAHNYLGITASQKGWQQAALKELETAIELNPKYGDACFNLAVVYAMQQPPNKELARKYYQRATALGSEPDPQLEQLVK